MIEVRVIGQTVHYIVDGKSIVEPLPSRVLALLDSLRIQPLNLSG